VWNSEIRHSYTDNLHGINVFRMIAYVVLRKSSI